MLDAKPEKFDQGIAAWHYQGIAGVAKATAIRELADWHQKQCLQPTDAGGPSTRYKIVQF